MPKLSPTTLVAFVSTVALSGVACAQDAEWTTEPAADVNHFVTADADASGTLTMDEFQVYAVLQADAGDADYTDLLTSGEYAKYFAAKDTDADGFLSEAELASSKDEASMLDPQVIDSPDMIQE